MVSIRGVTATCCINTAKGFTGQYNDSLTGLDYYGARYYDPVAGVFLSADTAQGNAQGMNPYAYVNGNPETYSDPSGRYLVGPGGQRYYPPVVVPTNNSSGNGGISITFQPHTPPLKLKPKPPTQSQIDNAKDDANHAGAVFAIIATALGVVTVSAGKLAAWLGQLAAWMWSVAVPAAFAVPFVGPILGILAVVAATLVSTAAAVFATLATTAVGVVALALAVSGKFWFKGSDHNTSQDKWTRSAMDNFQQEVDTIIEFGTGVIAAYATLRATVSNLLTGPLERTLPEALKAAGANIIVPSTTIGGGGIALASVADYWIGVMNSDLGYA